MSAGGSSGTFAFSRPRRGASFGNRAGRADDALILERAVQEQRTLVTLDEHFGDWVVLPLSKHFGVIRVKAHPPSTENVAKVLLSLLENRSQPDFRNRLVIVSPNRVRWIQTTDE